MKKQFIKLGHRIYEVLDKENWVVQNEDFVLVTVKICSFPFICKDKILISEMDFKDKIIIKDKF